MSPPPACRGIAWQRECGRGTVGGGKQITRDSKPGAIFDRILMMDRLLILRDFAFVSFLLSCLSFSIASFSFSHTFFDPFLNGSEKWLFCRKLAIYSTGLSKTPVDSSGCSTQFFERFLEHCSVSPESQLHFSSIFTVLRTSQFFISNLPRSIISGPSSDQPPYF